MFLEGSDVIGFPSVRICMLYTIQAYAPKGNYNGFSMKVYTKNGEENGADENYFWIGSLEGNKRNREEKAKLKERNGSKKEENKKAGGIHAQFPAVPMLNFRRISLRSRKFDNDPLL